jgi:hypothetical protein
MHAPHFASASGCVPVFDLQLYVSFALMGSLIP